MNRRRFLKYTWISIGSLIYGSSTVGYAYHRTEKVKTKVHIVIVGAGAGGLTTAAKLSQRLDGARITIVDGKKQHHYQPGFSMIGCGIYTPDQVTRNNADYIPDNVNWLQEMVVEYDPESNTIRTAGGKKIKYDILVVSAGAQMNYSAISGLDQSMLGKNGIGSVYHSPEIAQQTWHEVQRFINSGGIGLFTKPDSRIKCAGAPLKAAFLTEDLVRKNGQRNEFEFSYFTSKNNLFGLTEVNELCLSRCQEKAITPRYSHTLTAIDADRKVASFKTAKGLQQYNYDYIHIVPPMSAPDTIKNSPLSWKTGEHSKGGWIEVDKYTLQHRRYDNVFGVGDVIGTPMGKTAASVKYESPIVAENIVNLLRGNPPQLRFSGYTSCPIATSIGCVAVVEFDYTKKLTPTLPFLHLINDDNGLGWQIKVHLIKPMYFQMIQGRLPA